MIIMLKYSYDKRSDILYVYDEGESVKSSLDIFPGFVVDINHSNRIVGLEIIDASELFNVPKSWIDDLKNMKLSTIMSNNYFGFIFSAIAKEKEITQQVSSPLKLSTIR